jgi:glycosyltransferase involved in cell wall biosynthesis
MEGRAPDHAVCIIPAYNPSFELPKLAHDLRALGLTHVVVVNDGSSPETGSAFRDLPADPGLHLLHHATNLGKGAALKTGLNYAYCQFPHARVFVTADADGQHTPADIVRVVQEGLLHPDALVLGVRSLRSGVPLRSRVGNQVTRKLVHWLMGSKLTDTQTGLRAIPRSLVPVLLRIPATGYEFELDMLVAAKHAGIPLRELPIQTIYLDGNRSSHFNPLLDSMKIYFVLLRFSAVAVVTAIIDNAVFMLTFSFTANILESQVAGRLVALVFNYQAARRAVFLSRGPHKGTIGKYLLLVVANAAVSYALINLFMQTAAASVLWSKVAAESLLFLANFALQRDFVFTGAKGVGHGDGATDWDHYYQSVPATAHLTRRYTARILDRVLRRYSEPAPRVIVEIGGANSCFADQILARWPIEEYRVLDTNERGLDLLRSRYPEPSAVVAENADVLAAPARGAGADVVFSVGLIEHFQPEDTRRAVLSHFQLVRDGGLVILSFPSPTTLYRLARALCEALGVWRFPDERPLAPEEVLAAVEGRGEVLFRKTLWPLIFTQHMIAVRAGPRQPR